MSDARRPGLYGLLAQRPALLAWVLQLRARSERASKSWRTRPVIAAMSTLTVLLPAAFVISTASQPTARQTIEWLIAHDILVGVAAALCAVLSIMRRRALLATERASLWLLATPLAHRDLTFVSVLRIAIAAVLEGLAIVFLIVAIGLISGASGAVSIVAAVTAGLAIGAAVGSLWPLPHRKRDRESSRYVPKLRARSVAAAPSFRGLSHWPIAHALAWHRPENSRWLFIVAALSVPAGTSAFLGIGILAVWSLGSYLIALMRAVREVAGEAASWLRPTTIARSQFAWALVQRALVHQCLGTTLLAGVLVAIGTSYAAAAYVTILWLAIVLVTAAVGVFQSFSTHEQVQRRGVSRVRA